MSAGSNVVLVRRMLLKDKNGILWRIVGINNSLNVVWICRTDDDSWPIPISTPRLIEDLDPDKGQFVIELDDPDARPRIIATGAQEKATDRRQRERYDLLEPLLSDDNADLILSKRECKKLVAERLKQVKSTRQTMYFLLKLWWKRGMTYEALRPDYANCGLPSDLRHPTTKLGRPRTISPGTGIIVNDDVRKILRIAADYWLTRKRPTLQDAIDHICRLKYSIPVKDQNGRVIGFEVEEDKKPTARQLQYFIHTNYSYSHIRRRRKGDRYWNLQGRPLPGRASSDIQGPGDRFIIDATVADEYLVSQFDRRRIVGRPVIYFVIDDYSSLIVGVYVGFEGPSWIGAMMALINMVTPKVEFCRQYDIPIEESDWPSHYAGRRLCADKGELMSVPLGKNITNNLHIQIENPASGRPDLKALVERRFGIVPAKWRPFALGYVEKDFNQRGAEDSRLKASYNLYEFTQLVILAILEHNLEPIRDKTMAPAMITDGLEASPLDLWEWGIENRSGDFLHALTVDEVALNVMPSCKARITENGIRLGKGIYYSCNTAIREEWFAKARIKEWDIEMSFDPRKLEHAYLRDPKLPRGFEVCNLMKSSNDCIGKSLFEIEELDVARKKTEAGKENERQEKRLFIDYKMSQIQKKAKRETKESRDPNASKSSRIRGIRENRAQEKDIQRQVEAIDLSGGNAQLQHSDHEESNAATSSDLLMKDLDLLKKKQKQREGEEANEKNRAANS